MALEDSDPKVPPRPLPELTTSDEGKPVIGSDDLVTRERRRIGDYLAYQTQQVFKNKYQISPGSEIFKQRTASGNPAPITDTDNNAVSTYMDDVASTDAGQVARSIFESTSDSGMLDTDTAFKIKKGKSDENYKTGDDYFREVNQLGGEAEVPQRVEKALLDNNRFSAKAPAYSSGQREGSGNSIGSLIVQPELGQHVPQKFPKKKNDEGGDFISIPVDKLKNFGLTTLLQASGEINVPTDLSNPLLALGANATAGIPGLARVGQRVPVTRFDSVKILNDLEPTYSKQLRDLTLQGNSILSYGNVNNPLVPFAGLLNASSVASAQVLASTVAEMLRGLYVTLEALSEEQKRLASLMLSDSENPSPSKERRLRLGNYIGKDDETAVYRPYKDYVIVDMVQTKYPYFQCVNKGITVFFGTENNNAQFLLVNNKNIELSSGWYNTVFRSLIKNTGDLLSRIVPNGSPGPKSSYDVDPAFGGSSSLAVDVATTAVSYVKEVNNSSLLKFMNILALIGEAAFFSDDNQISVMDDIIDTVEGPEGITVPRLGVLQMKNRLSDRFGNKLAWANNTVKSMYLLPSQIKLAGEKLDGDGGRFSSLTPEKGFRSSDTGRLSGEQLDQMEEYLEADYLPFYFHDLRTNEIISFHAFLDQISDSYQVDYTENEGYGRVGKVLTYKNTNRTISLTFMVVATSLDDFDEMWFKVNKLITLLYPQYTQGRSLQLGEDSFVQPFSQLPSASPLIRLRLGDLFKSNYNRFDLARIFGLGSSDFHIGTEAEREASSTEADRLLGQNRDFIRQEMEAGHWEPGDIADLSANWTPGSGRGRAPRETSYQRVVETTGPGAATSAERAAQSDLSIVSIKQVRIVNAREFPRGDGRGWAIQLVAPAGTEESGTFVVPVSALSANDAEVERQAREQTSEFLSTRETSDREQNYQALQDFFKPEGDSPNPIFKSFESVRGKGLAGFIRSMNFDIDSSFTWETVGINNRAPKLLKVSIQFEPIHDIQPGLDNNGFNNAPVYNVGGMMKKLTRKNEADSTARDTTYQQNTQVTTTRNGRRGST